MNAIQSLNRRKWILSLGIVVFLLLGISGCSKEKPSLKGRWEMFVGKDPSLMGQEYGVDNLIYCMELDFSERTFDTEMKELPSGKKSYGFMNFSTISRIYRYDIDSVSYIGNNKYRLVSLGSHDLQLYEDTLTFNPKTNEITYGKDDVFKYVSGLRPFVGEWEMMDNEGTSEYVKLSLYQEIKAPDEYPLNGQSCYGYIVYDTDVDISHKLITSVVSSNALGATVMAVFPDNPEGNPMQVYFDYNWKDGTLIMDGGAPLPNKNGAPVLEELSANDSFLFAKVGIWIFVLAILLVVSLILLNVLDVEGAIRFWLPVIELLAMSVLILFLACNIFCNEGKLDLGEPGLMSVLKLYGAVILVAGSFLFGLFSILLWLYEGFGYFSKTPTTIAAVIAVILLAIHMFTGNMLFDILAERFIPSLMYQDGLFGFIMALLVVAVGLLFIVQMIILAVSVKGIYRIAILLLYPVFFAAGIVLLISSMAVVIVAMIVCAIIAFVLAPRKVSESSGNTLPESSDNNNDSQEEDCDAIIKGAGPFGGDVKAKDISFFKDKSLLKGENGKEYKRNDDGKLEEQN
ncbi:hypothetical protein [uncultured Bacteroides sp.]|uniref:hypothetical protein n=1 Tax=uncultured Bacteroides sp. TaxID=162156 RepID=UPI00262E3CDE|nr:hypothetical protein [uncultured Bacteroides sp.]